MLCPYFQKPCLQEECIAFDSHYTNYEDGKVFVFCHALDRVLPLKVEPDPE